MKKLLIGLLALSSLSALAKRDMDKTCQFSVNNTNDENIYSRVLAKKHTGLNNEKLTNGYRVNLDATTTKGLMVVKYSDVNSPSASELHTLFVEKSGSVKKVITDVNGDTVVLRLICAYDNE